MSFSENVHESHRRIQGKKEQAFERMAETMHFEYLYRLNKYEFYIIYKSFKAKK